MHKANLCNILCIRSDSVFKQSGATMALTYFVLPCFLNQLEVKVTRNIVFEIVFKKNRLLFPISEVSFYRQSHFLHHLGAVWLDDPSIPTPLDAWTETIPSFKVLLDELLWLCFVVAIQPACSRDIKINVLESRVVLSNKVSNFDFILFQLVRIVVQIQLSVSLCKVVCDDRCVWLFTRLKSNCAFFEAVVSHHVDTVDERLSMHKRVDKVWLRVFC